MSHLIQKRISTVPMPKEYQNTDHSSKQDNIRTVSTSSRPTFIEPIYIPFSKETRTVLPSIVVENPYVKVEHGIFRQIVAVSQPVFFPVVLPSREIGFVPVVQRTNMGVLQVNNPVFHIVSQGHTVHPLSRMVPNLVRS